MLRHILRFYSSFAPATILITLACASIYWLWGVSTLVALVWFKLITNFLVGYVVSTVNEKKIYYYYNLHISRTTLWLTSLGFDMLLMIALFSFISPRNNIPV